MHRDVRWLVAVVGAVVLGVDATAPSDESWGNETVPEEDVPPDRTVLKLAVAGAVFSGLMCLGLAYCMYRYYQFEREDGRSKEAFENAFSDSLGGGDVELAEVSVDYQPPPSPATGSLVEKKKKVVAGSWREAAGFSDVSTPIWLGPRRGHASSVTSTVNANGVDIQTLRSSFRSPPNSGSTAATAACGTSRQGGSGSSSVSERPPRSRNVTFVHSSPSLLRPPASPASQIDGAPLIRTGSKPILKSSSMRNLTTHSAASLL